MASNTLPPGCSMHPAIHVVDTPHGRGLRAAKPIKAGEVLLYAPAAAQLDGVDADADDLYVISTRTIESVVRTKEEVVN